MRRLTLIAGSGTLVSEILPALRRRGEPLQIIDVAGREDLTGTDLVHASLSAPAAILEAVKSFRTTHLAFAGGVHISDGDREAIRTVLGPIGRLGRSLGDVGLTGSLFLWARAHGYKVIGAHTLAPELLARDETIAGAPLDRSTALHVRRALRSARAIGSIDLGQSVVCAGSRLIAAEDIGGTDALLVRVADLRRRGLAGNGTAPLILAKALKPRQPKFIDLPSIGPNTILGCVAAGISIVAVEAGSSLLLERPKLIETANQARITVVGMRHG